MEHVKWPEITSFHNVRKMLVTYPELLNDKLEVTYRAKVKLHGTNAAVQVSGDGTVSAQSRTALLTPTSDNAGFAKWVEANKERWANLNSSYYPNALHKKYLGSSEQSIVVFGEWCGPGIQKGVAVNQLSKKIFAIFAVQALPGDELIIEPSVIQELTQHNIPDAYVLPWYGPEILVRWLAASEELEKTIEPINEMVAVVEKTDPWIKETFDVDGLGEGLVFYPISHPGRKAFSDLSFKAKGEKHKVVNAKTPAQVNPEAAANTGAFADLVLTEARLEQGARAVADGELVFSLKTIGKFLGWVGQDVSKECQAELEASKLEWKAASKAVNDKARLWYLDKCKTL